MGTHSGVLFAGKDATEDFDEIGHSKSARELLANYKIGAYAVSLASSPLQD